MSDTLLRHWTLLRAIPRAPRSITVAELHRHLEGQGYSARRRTVERDLELLSGVFPLLCDDSARPCRWSWPQDRMLDVPGMDPTTALTFALAHRFLEQVLPRTTLGLLKPYFEHARAVLDAAAPSGLAAWPDKVRILPRGLKLIGPEIDPKILDTVYGALLADRRFQCIYRRRDADEDKDYDVNPLGLVVRDAVIYLVCTFWEYNDIKQVRQLALHRIRTAELLDTQARRPPGFTLDGYIREGAFSMPFSDQPIRLEALFDAGAARHLCETKLSEDQVLEDQPDGRVLVKATVQDTGELRWWLLGFGESVTVRTPEDIISR